MDAIVRNKIRFYIEAKNHIYEATKNTLSNLKYTTLQPRLGNNHDLPARRPFPTPRPGHRPAGQPTAGVGRDVDWKAFRPLLNRVRTKTCKSSAGRKPWNAILMFKGAGAGRPL